MSLNPFDQASRYTAKLDPEGFLRWLLAEWTQAWQFRDWLDTRTLPFPGEPERTGDTVVDLEETDSGVRYALPVEFQTEPEVDMPARVLEYSARVLREKRPDGQLEQRFTVIPALVHLTGRGRTARVMRLGTTSCHITVDPVERNLCEEDAALTLTQIAEGRWSKALLPWIPLMRGGSESAIMEQWKEVAQSEPNARRRSDYAGLALVFSELTRGVAAWRKALEGWNVRQSMQVLEWQAEARKEGREEGREEGTLAGTARSLLRLLEKRFPRRVPATVKAQIKASTDLAQLEAWFDAAVNIGSMKEFRELLK